MENCWFSDMFDQKHWKNIPFLMVLRVDGLTRPRYSPDSPIWLSESWELHCGHGLFIAQLNLRAVDAQLNQMAVSAQLNLPVDMWWLNFQTLVLWGG